MLYELLTGRRPFTGSLMEVFAAVQQQEPQSPRSIDPSISKDLETITLKCLTKSPAGRYMTCQQLAFELERSRGRIRLMHGRLEEASDLLGGVEKIQPLRACVRPLCSAVAIGFVTVLFQWNRAERILAEYNRVFGSLSAMKAQVENLKGEIEVLNRQHEQQIKNTRSAQSRLNRATEAAQLANTRVETLKKEVLQKENRIELLESQVERSERLLKKQGDDGIQEARDDDS